MTRLIIKAGLSAPLKINTKRELPKVRRQRYCTIIATIININEDTLTVVRLKRMRQADSTSKDSFPSLIKAKVTAYGSKTSKANCMVKILY